MVLRLASVKDKVLGEVGGFLFSVALSVCKNNGMTGKERTISVRASQNLELSYVIRFFLVCILSRRKASTSRDFSPFSPSATLGVFF